MHDLSKLEAMRKQFPYLLRSLTCLCALHLGALSARATPFATGASTPEDLSSRARQLPEDASLWAVLNPWCVGNNSESLAMVGSENEQPSAGIGSPGDDSNSRSVVPKDSVHERGSLRFGILPRGPTAHGSGATGSGPSSGSQGPLPLGFLANDGSDDNHSSHALASRYNCL